MTARDQAAFTALVTAANTAPPAVMLSDPKWIRLQSIIEAKTGAFGSAVHNRLKAKLVATDGPGEALTEEEAKQSLAVLKIAAQQAVGPHTPLAGIQLTEALKQLPEIVESIMNTQV